MREVRAGAEAVDARGAFLGLEVAYLQVQLEWLRVSSCWSQTACGMNSLVDLNLLTEVDPIVQRRPGWDDQV